MGLQDGYGVLIGQHAGFKPDDPNDFGHYMHGVLTVRAPDGLYTCAIDVDTRNGLVPVHWRVQPLRIEEWAGLLALADGWHLLASAQGSGAVDYIRDVRLKNLFLLPDIPELVQGPIRFPFPPEQRPTRRLDQLLPHRTAVGPAKRMTRLQLSRARNTDLARMPVTRQIPTVSRRIKLNAFSGKLLFTTPPWNFGTSAQALADLEAVLASAVRVMVFGEPFHTGKGVHNIHQNQGDPVGSSFAVENAIWQDGVTIAIRADGTAAAFMNKFGTQSDKTDDLGRPLP